MKKLDKVHRMMGNFYISSTANVTFTIKICLYFLSQQGLFYECLMTVISSAKQPSVSSSEIYITQVLFCSRDN